MKEERLKQLLEKYYSGDTSLDEERELRDYFSANDIYQGYETEKDILSGYSKSEKTPVPSPGFEQRILMAVDDLEERQVKRILRKRSSSAECSSHIAAINQFILLICI